MLTTLNLGDGGNLGTADGKIALDCSVRKTRQGHYAISTTDFFFPLVDSPYLQGRIGAANVLSDLYAEGTDRCDFMLMLLAVSSNMPEDQRSICTTKMVEGFRDACAEADAPITGGQTVMNPWPIIGGVATSIVAESEFVPSDGAVPGDVLVLTKPLGTQIAVNVHQWRRITAAAATTQEQSESTSLRNHIQRWEQCLNVINNETVAEDMMHAAVCSMARLNRNGGRLMTQHSAHAGTDVTGFGILGHAQNLASNQKIADIGIEIDVLPCLAGTVAINQHVLDFGLLRGTSAETSGGLMICMPESEAENYCTALKELDGTDAWIVGRVVNDPERKAKLVDDCRVLEV